MDPTPSPTKWQLASLTTSGKGNIQIVFLEFGETCPGNRPKSMSMGNWESLKTALFVLICIKALLGGKPSQELLEGLPGAALGQCLGRSLG